MEQGNFVIDTDDVQKRVERIIKHKTILRLECLKLSFWYFVMAFSPEKSRRMLMEFLSQELKKILQ